MANRDPKDTRGPEVSSALWKEGAKGLNAHHQSIRTRPYLHGLYPGGTKKPTCHLDVPASPWTLKSVRVCFCFRRIFKPPYSGPGMVLLANEHTKNKRGVAGNLLRPSGVYPRKRGREGRGGK